MRGAISTIATTVARLLQPPTMTSPTSRTGRVTAPRWLQGTSQCYVPMRERRRQWSASVNRAVIGRAGWSARKTRSR